MTGSLIYFGSIAIITALLLAGCTLDVNGTHIVKGSPKPVTCTQESPDLIECRTP